MKLPASITLDGVQVWPLPKSTPAPAPGCPGWTRAATPRDAATLADLSVVEWRHADSGIVMVDVMSRRTDRLVKPSVDGVVIPIRPLAGLPFESGHPKGVDGTTPLTQHQPFDGATFDATLRKLSARVPVDHYLVHEGGSPRESGYEAIREVALSVAPSVPIVTPAMVEHLGMHTSAQVNRGYQDPDADGLPSGLTGVAHEVADGAGASAFLDVPFWAGHCPCHFTVDKLATAYELTGNPRALDQLVRLVTHAFRTEDYLVLHADKYGRVSVNGFYFNTPRMIGWPLKGAGVAGRTLRLAAQRDPGSAATFGRLALGLRAFCEVHVAHILERWPVGVWSPFETSDPRGGHSKEPHDVVFMQAVLAMGAATAATHLSARDASTLKDRSVGWIDRYGWDRSNPDALSIYYDALKAGGGTGGGTVSNGVRLWTVRAMTGSGTELEDRLVREARATDFWGVKDIDTKNLLFPGLEWIGGIFRQRVRGGTAAADAAVGGAS